jgi:hypothetical protein
VTLVAAGQKSRDEIVSYFAELFRGKLARQWSNVWDALVSGSSDLGAAELLDDIERAYEEGLVDPGFIGFDHVKRDLAMGKDQALAGLADSSHNRLVDDTVAEMGWWYCFQPSAPVNPEPAPSWVPSPIENTRPKTGRNEPCPCGSGKKYKKCCGA